MNTGASSVQRSDPRLEPPLDPMLVAPFEGCKLVGVRRLGHCIDLPSLTLLHAGPAYQPDDEVPLPVKQSAIQTMMHQGIATDANQADKFLNNGIVDLQPAQDHLLVTPLAQVVGRQSWVFVVSDGRHTRYAPCVESPAPALRSGSSDPDCLERLALIESWLPHLDRCLEQHPVDMQAIIQRGLLGGDECHAVTRASQAAFVETVLGEMGLSEMDWGEASLLETLTSQGALSPAQPWFVLPVLMATCAVALARAGMWCAVGANGVDFGYKPRLQDDWVRITAPALRGVQPDSDTGISSRLGLARALPTRLPLPAIGDSAVIDFAGLGAQALHMSPAMQALWREHLPDQSWPDRLTLIDPSSGLVCPRRAHSLGKSAFIHLAMVDGTGSGQLLGPGVCQVPVSKEHK